MDKMALRNGRRLSVKWLVCVPMYTSAAIAGWALASMFHERNWDPLDWQALIVGFVVLFVLVALVMTPLLIVQQLLEQADDEKEEA